MKACVINGEERVPVTHMQISGDYELRVAGSCDKGKASETLPVLNEVIAYPTMIVLDRSVPVRRVHIGFYGSGAGKKYYEFRRESTAFIEQLLAEEQS